MAPRHEGRVALVTGVSLGEGGIGRAIAGRLLQDGATVVVADRSEGVEAAAAELAGELPQGRVLHFCADLSDESAVSGIVRQVVATLGSIDILVNNAGGGVIRPFLEHDAASLAETMSRNLWTVVWCCHKVLPHMVAAKWGRIINIGADSVRTGLHNHAGYNAAKGGVHGLTTGLAREFADYDITVNTVAPSAVETSRLAALRTSQPELVKRYLQVIPKGRGAYPGEIGAMVSYLASAEAAFVTGQVFSINGGSAML